MSDEPRAGEREEAPGWVEAALGTGAAGALAVTSLHETARRLSRKAPRMDVLGMRALAKLIARSGRTPPRRKRLHRLALVGELLSNSLYYALIALLPGPRPVLRGAAVGAVAGVGGIVLPPWLGLGRRPSAATFERKVMAVGWYLLGGVAAGVAYKYVFGPVHA